MADTCTPSRLAEELGLQRGMRVWFHHMPDSIRAAIDPDSVGVEEQISASDGLQGVHLFVSDPGRLPCQLRALRGLLAPNGFVWVAWPASLATVSRQTIMDVATPLGLVATRDCTLDSVWSAIRFINRRAEKP